MCGFWGKFSINNFVFSNSDISRVRNFLTVRGSDEFNYLQKKNFFLAHSRLHLSGNSYEGKQPTVSSCENYFMLFNGEIYNYRNLSKIYNINTSSDTEVLFRLIIKVGFKKALSKIRGMFSIVFLDKIKSNLYLSVDKFGQKPLYYNQTNTDIIFGSTAKSVTRYLSTDNLRNSQLDQYYHFGFVGPHESIFKDVSRVHPNQILQFNSNNFSLVHDHFNHSIDLCATDISHNGHLDSTFREFFSEYVDCSFPTGVSLSGGIDSSIVSYYYSKFYTGEKIAFTVDIEDPMYSEYNIAKKYAKKLGIKLINISLGFDNCYDFWFESGQCLDEPNGDTGVITNLALIKESSKHVKCLLTGDGGDEIFEGYNRHAACDFLYSNSMFENTIKKFLLSKIINHKNLFTKLLIFLKPALSQGDISARLNTLRRVLLINQNSKSGIVDVLEGFYHEVMSIDKSGLNNFFSLENARRLVDYDRQFYLPGNNFTRMDKISLYYNVEARSPLVDDRIFSFSQNLDYRLKQNKLKGPLKNLHYSIYGERKIPKKGFNYPINHLLANSEFKSFYESGLEFYESVYNKSLKDSDFPSERRIYNLASFGLWLSLNFD